MFTLLFNSFVIENYIKEVSHNNTMDINKNPILDHVPNGIRELKATKELIITARGNGITRACYTTEIIKYKLQHEKINTKNTIKLTTEIKNNTHIVVITINMQIIQE